MSTVPKVDLLLLWPSEYLLGFFIWIVWGDLFYVVFLLLG